MAKRAEFTEPEPETTNVNDLEQETYGAEGNALGDLDFNLDEEYKEDPLVPQGTYRANVVSVVANAEKCAIVWKVCIVENGGVMSDGTTPIDGSHLIYNCWIPKPGDENLMEANGRVTKRQGKINRLAKFANKMKINMSTPAIIARAIGESEWVGLPVIVKVGISEYQGNIRNDVEDMTARAE